MRPFLSAGVALKWALVEHEAWMFGKAIPVGPQTARSTDGHQAHVLAISILTIASSCDIVDQQGDSWLYCWYVKELPECAWKCGEISSLRDMRNKFAQALADERIIFLDRCNAPS